MRNPERETLIPEPADSGKNGSLGHGSAGHRCLDLVIGIATFDRREVLRAVMPFLSEQTRLPDRLIISVADPAHIDEEVAGALPFPVEIVLGPAGLCRQRNRIIEYAGTADLVVFLDDDFLLAPSFLEEAERLFFSCPDVAVASGHVLSDGVCGLGYDVSTGRAILANDGSGTPPGEAAPSPRYAAYGCNMLIRMEPVRRNRLQFDERLALYGWLEDVDFSRRVARYGRIVGSARLRGVHLGVKAGRTSGVRFGYSQIANPIYLMRRGSLSLRFGGSSMLRNLSANIFKALRPEPWVDRRGRLKGNFIAIADVLRGRIDPAKVERL